MSTLTVPTPTLPDAGLLLLSLTADGLTRAEIAAATGLRQHIVKHRMANLQRSHGFEAREQAVAYAYRVGWFTRVPQDPPEPPLTPRQLDIVQLLVDGRHTREILATLGLRPNGLASHLERIFTRTGARNRSHLIRIAVDTAIVPRRSQ